MNAGERLIWENVFAAGNEKCTISDGRDNDINPTNQDTILWRLIYIANCKI